eukprot:PITA_27337
MSSYEREGSIRPPIFDGSNFFYWKVRTTAYLQSLGIDVWEIVEGGYTFPSAIPTDTASKKQYETNAKAVNTLLGSLSQLEFVKVMQLKTAKEIWDKIILSYEGDNLVKRAKLQSLIIQYETLKMHNDENISHYFLRIDEIVNRMKNLGEEIKEVTLVENVLRSLSSKFESKVSAIEEKQDLQSMTMTQLHGILTAIEIRKGGPSDMREIASKASGREELNESGHISEGEEEANFVKNLQSGSTRFRGKLPFKCFACGRVGHYAAKCPHKDKLDKEMVYQIDEDGLYEEISKLEICLEENNMIIDTLTFQLVEREKHNEKLECEIVGLRKDIEKTKALNLRFAKGSKILDEIIKLQHSPLIKTGLGYIEEESQAQKPSTSKIYLEATRRSEQVDNCQQRHKADHQVSRFDNRRTLFNGHFFSCHNFGHKAAQCVAYKTIMTREARNQRNVTGIMKRTYNKFFSLENEIECSICNNFGHEDSKCRSKFRKTSQKEQASLGPKTWRKKEPQTEICGIALYAEGQENQWYTDSGCSKHMTGDKEKLQPYNALEKEKKVSFGNDTPAVIKGKGFVLLKEKVKDRNVMYVDGLKHNLLSVSQMCDQGNEVVFRSNGCVVCELDIGETLTKGVRTPNNLYILKEGQKQTYLSKND